MSDSEFLSEEWFNGLTEDQQRKLMDGLEAASCRPASTIRGRVLPSYKLSKIEELKTDLADQRIKAWR